MVNYIELSQLQHIQSFMEEIFLLLANDEIDVSKFDVDHICYRVETLDEYNYVKKLLGTQGRKISENKINGRPISIFKLTMPLIYEKRIIRFIELPAPKPGVFYKRGFEHVEFVVPSLEELKQSYHNITFQVDNIPNNLSLTIKYGELSVKFHEK